MIVTKTMTTHLRKFGLNLALGMSILGCIMFYQGKGHFIYFTGIGLTVFILAVFCPKVLKPLRTLMDGLIHLLGWITTIITTVFSFYLIFTPIALIMKLFRKDLLGQRIDKQADTYWLKTKQRHFSKEYYERMG